MLVCALLILGSRGSGYYELERYFARRLTSKPELGVCQNAFGPLMVKENRDTFLEMICALNCMFPDYEFGYCASHRTDF